MQRLVAGMYDLREGAVGGFGADFYDGHLECAMARFPLADACRRRLGLVGVVRPQERAGRGRQ